MPGQSVAPAQFGVLPIDPAGGELEVIFMVHRTTMNQTLAHRNKQSDDGR
jgi:hypothetical protein